MLSKKNKEVKLPTIKVSKGKQIKLDKGNKIIGRP